MPRRKCIWKSLSSGARVVSPLSHPALRIISLRNLPDRSHSDCLSFRPPGSVHSSLSWKLMFTSYPRLWAREITGFPAAGSFDSDADWRPRESWPKTSTRYRRWKSVNAGCRMSWRSICRTIHHETIVWFAVCLTVRLRKDFTFQT